VRAIALTLFDAFLLCVFLCAAASAKKPKPAVVILCAKGGVLNHGSLLANAADCVGHDKYGSMFSARAIAVFAESAP
jgi:hypothetical protein